MRLLIVRHARAFERDDEQWPDDRGRPLTPAGKREFARSAGQWRKLLPAPSQVWSSPLARAWQTAVILAKEARWPEPVECAELEPGAEPRSIIELLARISTDDCIALVGHEPDLHLLVATLVSGSSARPIVSLKKGGMAELRCEGPVAEGAMTLLRLIRPD